MDVKIEEVENIEKEREEYDDEGRKFVGDAGAMAVSAVLSRMNLAASEPCPEDWKPITIELEDGQSLSGRQNVQTKSILFTRVSAIRTTEGGDKKEEKEEKEEEEDGEENQSPSKEIQSNIPLPEGEKNLPTGTSEAGVPIHASLTGARGLRQEDLSVLLQAEGIPILKADLKDGVHNSKKIEEGALVDAWHVEGEVVAAADMSVPLIFSAPGCKKVEIVLPELFEDPKTHDPEDEIALKIVSALAGIQRTRWFAFQKIDSDEVVAEVRVTISFGIPAKLTGPVLSEKDPRWVQNATKCAICDYEFSHFSRRHHCRRCGRAVCGTHSSDSIHLDDSHGLLRCCQECCKTIRWIPKELRQAIGPMTTWVENRSEEDSAGDGWVYSYRNVDGNANQCHEVAVMVNQETTNQSSSMIITTPLFAVQEWGQLMNHPPRVVAVNPLNQKKVIPIGTTSTIPQAERLKDFCTQVAAQNLSPDLKEAYNSIRNGFDFLEADLANPKLCRFEKGGPLSCCVHCGNPKSKHLQDPLTIGEIAIAAALSPVVLPILGLQAGYFYTIDVVLPVTFNSVVVPILLKTADGVGFVCGHVVVPLLDYTFRALWWTFWALYQGIGVPILNGVGRVLYYSTKFSCDYLILPFCIYCVDPAFRYGVIPVAKGAYSAVCMTCRGSALVATHLVFPAGLQVYTYLLQLGTPVLVGTANVISFGVAVTATAASYTIVPAASVLGSAIESTANAVTRVLLRE